MANISMLQLLEAGAHFGHQKRFWNPKMGPYIFGVRHRIHIINLEHTLRLYRFALHFLRNGVAKKGKVLFVGTKRAAKEIVRKEAVRCGMPYVDHRWLGGMLTNYRTIRQSVRRLNDLEAMTSGNKGEGLTKKERLMLARESEKLHITLAGIKEMGGLPDMLFIIDTGHEKTAIAEAKILKIPTIGIVDTNQDPTAVDYPIPGNDDSKRAIQLYCQGVADIILEARALGLAEEASESKETSETKAAEPAKTKRRVVMRKSAPKERTNSVSRVGVERRPAAAPLQQKTTKAPEESLKKAAATAVDSPPKSDDPQES